MERRKCHELLSSLSDYIDGDLEQEICDRIETHLQSCVNCRLVVDSLRRTISLYRDTGEEVALPEDVRTRLYQRLNLEEYSR